MLIVTLRSKEDPELFNTVYNATKVEAGFCPERAACIGSWRTMTA